MQYNLLSDVLTQPLAVDPTYMYAYWMMLQGLVPGNQTTGATRDYSAERAKLQSYAVSIEAGTSIRMGRYDDLNQAPKGSIAVIQLMGPVVKNSQFCGPRGTMEIAQDFNRARQNPNIIGAVFNMETGGGMALAVKPLADAMLSFRESKPIVVLSGDILASAGYYLACYGDEIMSEHPRAIVGSIGTMIAFADAKKMLEKQGVVFHEIYATDSTQKNKTFNEALNGNYKPIIENMLDPFNADFIADVKAQRKGRIAESNKLIFAGETFMASVAKELGMIDSLGNLNAAVARVEELATDYKPSTTTTAQNLNPDMKNLTAVLALAGVAKPTQEQIDLANAAFTEASITGATIVQESFITDAATATAQNTQLTADLAATTQKLTDTEASLTAANNKVTELEAKVEAFGKNAGAQHQQSQSTDTPPSEEDDADSILANLPHNKHADRMLGA